MFGQPEKVRESVKEMCQRVKSAKRLDPAKEIFLPGERGDLLEQQNLKNGFVRVPQFIYDKLTEMSTIK